MINPRCPNCEWANRPGLSACERCGAPLGGFAGPQAGVPPYGAPQQYQYSPPPPPPKKGLSGGVIAAIVIGALLVVGVPIVGVVAAIAIPSLLAARRASNESAAVGNLRTIASAEATYLSQTGQAGTFSDLVRAQMLDEEWRDGMARDGYRYRQVSVSPQRGTFEFAAEPESSSNGSRSFNIAEDYVIRYARGVTAPKGTEGTPIGY